ncbi:MAG: EamA family transporter [Mycobacteriales bacterium]|nr:EamA family transporter [Frankia sp.]
MPTDADHDAAHRVAPVDDVAGAPIEESERHMRPVDLALILFAVTLATLGQLMLRHGMQVARHHVEAGHGTLASNAITSLTVIGGLALFGVSAMAWLAALSRVPLSRAYPFNALGYVGILASSALFLHEHISALRWTGASLVVVGLVLVVQS